MWRFALIFAVAGAVGCSFETGGHVGDLGVADASAVGDPDAPGAPDAGPSCVTHADCATPPDACKLAGSCGADGECSYPEVDCSDEGDQCNVGACDPTTGACVKQAAFEGMSCGDVTTCGAFSDCAYDPSNSCDETGMRQRDCTDYTCNVGACTGAARVEQEPCDRDTDGDSCGATTCSGFGACGGFSTTCDESGTKERSCTARECATGACVDLPFTDTAPCTRASRDGISCAADSCGGYTECEYSPGNKCDETGVKVRLCTPFACLDEACVDGSPFTDTADCSRDTSEVLCDTVCTGTGEDITCEPVYCLDGSCPTG